MTAALIILLCISMAFDIANITLERRSQKQRELLKEQNERILMTLEKLK